MFSGTQVTQYTVLKRRDHSCSDDTMARFGAPKSHAAISEAAAFWDPRLCYNAREIPEPTGGLNLDHQAWATIDQQREEPTVAVPNARKLHPANDWSNLSIQKHRDKRTGLLRPTKTVNKLMLQVSGDLPEFMCAQALNTTEATKPKPQGKRSFAEQRMSSNGNPINPKVVPRENRRPKSSQPIRTPYAQQAAALHANDFNVRHRQYDRITANKFYGSVGGWGSIR